MEFTTTEIIMLLVAIIVHELGHYVAFRMKGIRPKIKIRWWGIEIGEGKDTIKMKGKDSAFIYFEGIAFGLFPLLIINARDDILLIYLLMCAIDIAGFIGALNHWNEEGHIYVKRKLNEWGF